MESQAGLKRLRGLGGTSRAATIAGRNAGSNAEFARDPRNKVFLKACELAGVPASKRQASKWRLQRGKAFAFKRAAEEELSRE